MARGKKKTAKRKAKKSKGTTVTTMTTTKTTRTVRKSNPTQAWDVFLNRKKIDTVFYSDKSTADDVYRSLVGHDGYDRDIKVRKARKSKAKKNNAMGRRFSGDEWAEFILESELESAGAPRDDTSIPPVLAGQIKEYERLLRRVLKQCLVIAQHHLGPRGGVTLEEVWKEDAPYAVLMTLRGEGVGIEDGRWDHLFDTPTLRALRQCLESDRELGAVADSAGGGWLNQGFQDVAYMRASDENPPRLPKRGRHKVKRRAKVKNNPWFESDLAQDLFYKWQVSGASDEIRRTKWSAALFRREKTIVVQDSQGDVYATTYSSPAEVDEAWSEMQATSNPPRLPKRGRHKVKRRAKAKKSNPGFRGRYLTGVETGRGLKISPTQEGMEEAQDAVYGGKNTHNVMFEMFEDWIGNGWTWIPPEAIGALTDAEIISPDAYIDDDGNVAFSGRDPKIYWFSDYQVVDPVQRWAEGESITFDLARSNNPNAKSNRSRRNNPAKAREANPKAKKHYRVESASATTAEEAKIFRSLAAAEKLAKKIKKRHGDGVVIKGSDDGGWTWTVYTHLPDKGIGATRRRRNNPALAPATRRKSNPDAAGITASIRIRADRLANGG